MDLVADSDYEMDASDWATQTQHETMDDAYSDMMAVSEPGGPASAADAPDVDVDFQDEATPADLTSASSSASQAMFLPAIVPTEVLADQSGLQAQASNTLAADTSFASQEEAKLPLGVHVVPTHKLPTEPAGDVDVGHEEPIPDPDELRDEEDELVEEQSAAHAVSAIDDGSGSSSEDLDFEEDNGAATEHEAGDEHGPEAVRVTFNGQDFVIWSSSEIASYLRIKETGLAEEAQTELEAIEAPALHVSEDVLWQPLDSFFVNLREKTALGEFLEEFSELVLTFSDLNLEVQEDNVYCRDITLDDLMQLHHGLNYTTSLHIAVTERPRFITKYNELAQHVAKLVSSQMDRSDDEADQSANPKTSVEVTHAEGEIATGDPASAHVSKEDGSTPTHTAEAPDYVQAESTTNGLQAPEVQGIFDQEQRASEKGNAKAEMSCFAVHENGVTIGHDDDKLKTLDGAHSQLPTTASDRSPKEVEYAQFSLDATSTTDGHPAADENPQTKADLGQPGANEHKRQESHGTEESEGEDQKEVVGEDVDAHALTREGEMGYGASEECEAAEEEDEGEDDEGEEDELQDDVDHNTAPSAALETYDADGTAEEEGYEEDEYEEEEVDEVEDETTSLPAASIKVDDIQVVEASAPPTLDAVSTEEDEEEEQILEYIDEVEDELESEPNADHPRTTPAHLSTRKRSLSEDDDRNGSAVITEGDPKRVRMDQNNA